MEMPQLDVLNTVRARFPSAPDADGPALHAHSALLADLRDRMDLDRLHGMDPAMTFDPRTPSI